jgi:hypothetical protein
MLIACRFADQRIGRGKEMTPRRQFIQNMPSAKNIGGALTLWTTRLLVRHIRDGSYQMCPDVELVRASVAPSQLAIPLAAGALSDNRAPFTVAVVAHHDVVGYISRWVMPAGVGRPSRPFAISECRAPTRFRGNCPLR